MSAKTAKISDETDALIKQGAAATDLSRKAILEKAIRYYVPRVIRGEISVVERPDGQRELPFPAKIAAGGSR